MAGTTRLQLKAFADPEESKRWSMWRLVLGSDLRAALAVEGESCRVRLGQWPLPSAEERTKGDQRYHSHSQRLALRQCCLCGFAFRRAQGKERNFGRTV